MAISHPKPFVTGRGSTAVGDEEWQVQPGLQDHPEDLEALAFSFLGRVFAGTRHLALQL